MVQPPIDPNGMRKFSFPVAFAPDLQQVSILGCVVRTVRPSDPVSGGGCHYACQSLQLWPRPGPAVISDQWYQVTFSPTGRFLAVLRGPGRPGPQQFYGRWELVIYKDHNLHLDEEPEYRSIASTWTCSNGGASMPFVFHPQYPVLACIGLSVTNLWLFSELGRCEPGGST
jgi:hypothetical protein